MFMSRNEVDHLEGHKTCIIRQNFEKNENSEPKFLSKDGFTFLPSEDDAFIFKDFPVALLDYILVGLSSENNNPQTIYMRAYIKDKKNEEANEGI